MLKVNYFRYSKTILKIQNKELLEMVKDLSRENNVWNSTRICTRTTIVYNIHKWSSWWNKFIVRTICRWHIPLELNDNFQKISHWAYQWKMQFNSDANKQTNEVIFSRKTSSNDLSHPPIKFNNNGFSKFLHQKHLGIVLDSKFNFNAHVDQKIRNCNRIIDLIRQLSINISPRL